MKFYWWFVKQDSEIFIYESPSDTAVESKRFRSRHGDTETMVPPVKSLTGYLPPKDGDKDGDIDKSDKLKVSVCYFVHISFHLTQIFIEL